MIKHIRLGMGFIAFIIFFAIPTLEAFQKQDWWKAFFWVLMLILFILIDNLRYIGKREKTTGNTEEEQLLQ